MEKEAIKELEEEKINMAKGVLKSKIKEIEKVERLLKTLKGQYRSVLSKSVDEISDGRENENIVF